MKICGITTKAITIKAFMLANLEYMARNGHQAFCISQYDDSLYQMSKDKGVVYCPTNIKWGNVSPVELCKNIRDLYKVFRREKFDIIQYATSNAGLCACIAGWLARIPVRVYCQWGISYTDYKGVKYHFYKMMEKLTCLLSTSIQPDSYSNLRFAKEEKLYNPSKGEVLYNGSACGVNLEKFDFQQRQIWKKEVLNELQIPNSCKVFGYVGRIVKEKGIDELIEAFKLLNSKDCYLVLVGPIDDDARLDPELLKWAKETFNIKFTGSRKNTEKYYAAFDFMLLPSYREGFGMTVVEAAALGTPSIITNINGPTDFIIDGYNGLVCDVKSVHSLYKAMTKALNMSIEDYSLLADNAYKEVSKKFDSRVFQVKFKENRETLLINSQR